MEIFSFVEIFTAVVMVLGGQQGFAAYRRRKFLNGHIESDRRRDSKSVGGMTSADRDFIKSCFDSLTMQIENVCVRQTMEISEAVRTEAAATRVAVRDRG